MIRPHLNEIPEVKFPSSFDIRPMSREDIGIWTDIQRDADPCLTINRDSFFSIFGDHLEALRWRCFIVTDPSGKGVGVASAWYNRDFRGRDYGRIHWMAIRPAWQGQGLGKATLSYVTEKLAEWHERAYLVTHARRTAAVKMYLDFGFQPLLTTSHALKLWENVSRSIKHPLLKRALGRAEEDDI